jgi:hypothetical protein
VHEFLDETLTQICSGKNHLLDLFPVGDSSEYLLCFADYGIFVGSDGLRSRSDLIWRETASQFFMSERRRLWMSLSGGIEVVDLTAESHRSRFYPSTAKYPRVLRVSDGCSACLMVDRDGIHQYFYNFSIFFLSFF